MSGIFDEAIFDEAIFDVVAVPVGAVGGGGGSGARIRRQEIDDAIDRVVARLDAKDAPVTRKAVVAEVKRAVPGVTDAQIRAALAVIREADEEEEAAVMLLAA